MTDVENLRAMALRLREMSAGRATLGLSFGVGSDEHDGNLRIANEINDEVNALDRAADALAILDAARGAAPLTVRSIGAGSLRMAWLPNIDDNQTEAATEAAARKALAHRLIATALALLESDRG